MKKWMGTLFLIMAMFLTSIPMNVSAEENGQLMYRLAEYDEETEEYIENINNTLYNSYETSINSEDVVFFYYLENDVEKKVAVSDLTFSDEDVIMLTSYGESEYVAVLGGAGFGNAEISYEAVGNTYSMNAVIGLPPVEVYSDSVASEEAFLEEFTLTDTENTFYVATTDGWELTDVVLDDELATFAETEISADKTYATITITQAPAEEEWFYNIQYSAEHSDGRKIEEESLSIWINSGVPTVQRELQYRIASFEDDIPIEDTEAPLWSSYDAEPGDKEYVWFYYVENEEETLLTISDLTSSDEDVVQISEDVSGAILLEIIEEGSATIDYIHDSVTYSVYVEAKVWVKDVAFYLENTADSADYIEEFTVTDTENTFYLVANNDWSITEVILDEEFAEIAEASISEDGVYAVITITGTPEDGYAYGLDCTLTDSEGGTLTIWETITLNNQKNEEGTLPPAGEDTEDGTLPPAGEDTEDGILPPAENDTEKPSEKPDKESPDTGKSISVWMWVSIFAVGCMVMLERKKNL